MLFHLAKVILFILIYMENNKKKKRIKWHINGNYERKKLNSLKEKKKIKYSPVDWSKKKWWKEE